MFTYYERMQATYKPFVFYGKTNFLVYKKKNDFLNLFFYRLNILSFLAFLILTIYKIKHKYALNFRNPKVPSIYQILIFRRQKRKKSTTLSSLLKTYTMRLIRQKKLILNTFTISQSTKVATKNKTIIKKSCTVIFMEIHYICVKMNTIFKGRCWTPPQLTMRISFKVMKMGVF